MPRPQFTLRALLVLLLAVACFLGGIRFERERQRREDHESGLASTRQQLTAAIDKLNLQRQQVAAGKDGDEQYERARREIFLTEMLVDQLTYRLNVGPTD
jgi:hypothetical protein